MPTIAVSSLVLATTIPSPPTDVIIVETFSDGFYLEWKAPDNNTNPLVDYYEYTVTVGSETESFVYYPIEAELLVFNLIPDTTCFVSICHTIYNVTSNCSSVSVSTAENNCSNLQNLPPHYLIGEFQRNAQGNMVAFISCDNGYQLAGDHRVVCNDTESSLPQCSIITCQIPSIPHAEKIVGPNTPRHTESVHWRCLNDYWISVGVSNFSSVCLEGDHEWQPPLQNCIEKPTCLQLTPPEHGRMNSTAHRVNDVVFFSCDMGYILQDPREKTCTLTQNHTAVWLPADEVTCHALECTLPSISNVTILSEVSDPSHGDTVQWECNGGYWISYGREDFNSTCFAGSWSPLLESCTEKPTCPSLTSPQNGSINSTVFYVQWRS